jgi:protein O-mannosyl-transferase
MQKKTKHISKKVKPQLTAARKAAIDVSDKRKIFIYLILISLCTLICYSPTFKNEMTNLDDEEYLIKNPLIKDFNIHTISKMFYTGTGKELFWMGNYHPLTMLSLNINYQMLSRGDFDEEGTLKNPFVFQLTNVLLHILNTVLVFFLISLLFNNFPIALITALFFGIHPLHVESVTWISERKDVLYTAFFLSSLIFYTRYIEKKNLINFILSFSFFLLSALSKGQAVGLGITLVAIDYLKNRNLLDFKLIVEKAFFIAAGIIFGIIAITAQQENHAVYGGFNVPIKVLIASWGFLQYFQKLIFPVNLSAFYPYPADRIIPVHYASGLILIGLIVYACIYFFKKSRGITFALAFYCINIFLLLQLIPVGYALMADRYVYVSSIGFFLLMGLLYQKLIDRKQISKNILIGICAVLTIYWGYLTFERTQIWKNSLTLWSDILEKQPKANFALLGISELYNTLAEKCKKDNDNNKYAEYKLQIISNLSKAIELNYLPGYYLRGVAKLDYGEALNDSSYITSSITDFDTAVKIDNDYPRSSPNRIFQYEFFEVLAKRAAAFEALGDFEKALSDYTSAIEAAPGNDEKCSSYFSRAAVKYKLHNISGAIDDLSFILEQKPENIPALSTRGTYYLELQSIKNACTDFSIAANLQDNSSILKFQKYCN